MEITSASLKNSLSKFIKRYHLLIFTVFVLGGLTLCMFLINGIIIKSGDTTSYKPATTDTTFDKQTIERIKQLQTADDNAVDDLNLGQGRSNPFVE